MIPKYVQIDMVIVSINTGNHTISLNKHTLGLEIYNSTCQYKFGPMWNALVKSFDMSDQIDSLEKQSPKPFITTSLWIKFGGGFVGKGFLSS